MTIREFLLFMVGVALMVALLVQWADRRFDDLGDRMQRLETVASPGQCPPCFISETAVMEQPVQTIQTKYVINQGRGLPGPKLGGPNGP